MKNNCHLHSAHSKNMHQIMKHTGGKDLRSILWAALRQYIVSLRISQNLTNLAADLMTEPHSPSCAVSYLVSQLDGPLVYLISCTHILIHLICQAFLFIKTSNPNWPHEYNKCAWTLPSYYNTLSSCLSPALGACLTIAVDSQMRCNQVITFLI